MRRAIQVAAAAALVFRAALSMQAGEALPNADLNSSANVSNEMSARMRGLLMAALRKFQAPVPAAVKPPSSQIGSVRPRENDPAIIRLPEFLVRAPKLPTDVESLTADAQAKLAMDRYLGSADGLDRGF
jgi:hypothetical protein